MIDNLSILLSHALLLIAFFILMNRPELDQEEPPIPDAEPEGFGKRPRAGKRKVAEDAPDA